MTVCSSVLLLPLEMENIEVPNTYESFPTLVMEMQAVTLQQINDINYDRIDSRIFLRCFYQS